MDGASRALGTQSPPPPSRVTSTSWKEVEGKVMEKVGI